MERGHSHCQTEVLAGWAWEHLFPHALLVPVKGHILPASGPTGPEQDRQVEYSEQVTCARPVGWGPQQAGWGLQQIGLSSGPRGSPGLSNELPWLPLTGTAKRSFECIAS